MTMHAMWARLEVKWHQVGFWGVPGERDSRVALGTPTTYHLLLLAQWIRGEKTQWRDRFLPYLRSFIKIAGREKTRRLPSTLRSSMTLWPVSLPVEMCLPINQPTTITLRYSYFPFYCQLYYLSLSLSLYLSLSFISFIKRHVTLLILPQNVFFNIQSSNCIIDPFI